MQFTGFDELSKKLNTMTEQYPKKRDQFLAQEAEKIIGRAKSETPVDTGRLRGAWHRTNPEDGRVDVYNNTDYANHVEYGHRTRTANGLNNNPGKLVPGRKMLHKAMLTTKHNFKEDAEEILGGLFE